MNDEGWFYDWLGGWTFLWIATFALACYAAFVATRGLRRANYAVERHKFKHAEWLWAILQTWVDEIRALNGAVTVWASCWKRVVIVQI
jgi:hypothetical protein